MAVDGEFEHIYIKIEGIKMLWYHCIEDPLIENQNIYIATMKS
jgi:hypothetical protein